MVSFEPVEAFQGVVAWSFGVCGLCCEDRAFGTGKADPEESHLQIMSVENR